MDLTGKAETFSPEQLDQIVRASMEGWRLFICAGLEAALYEHARERLGPQRAAAITLLHLYLCAFTADERRELERDPERFQHYAFGFIRELFPPRPKNQAYRQFSRAIFIGAMKQLLEEQRARGRAAMQDARMLMRAMLRLCTSAESILETWDLYREYCFRENPSLSAR